MSPVNIVSIFISESALSMWMALGKPAIKTVWVCARGFSAGSEEIDEFGRWFASHLLAIKSTFLIAPITLPS